VPPPAPASAVAGRVSARSRRRVRTRRMDAGRYLRAGVIAV
jgi:hypothetical protein